MIPTVSILVTIACAVGVYLFFFDGPEELIEQFAVSSLGGGQTDYRLFILIGAPLALGLLTYEFLLHLMGKPLAIPFL